MDAIAQARTGTQHGWITAVDERPMLFPLPGILCIGVGIALAQMTPPSNFAVSMTAFS